jgi:hypothetical protein
VIFLLRRLCLNSSEQQATADQENGTCETHEIFHGFPPILARSNDTLPIPLAKHLGYTNIPLKFASPSRRLYCFF